jgi:hypothetical protein
LNKQAIQKGRAADDLAGSAPKSFVPLEPADHGRNRLSNTSAHAKYNGPGINNAPRGL